MDELWRAYVNSDPDLRRFYRRKNMIEWRRMYRAYSRLYASTRPTWLPNPALQFLAMLGITFASVALLGALLILS